jgi:hypothetical protein
MVDGSMVEVEDAGSGSSGLVLPEEVVAGLAEELARRARSGEQFQLTGPDGVLSGVIGQILRAGLSPPASSSHVISPVILTAMIGMSPTRPKVSQPVA